MKDFKIGGRSIKNIKYVDDLKADELCKMFDRPAQTERNFQTEIKNNLKVWSQ